MSRYEGKIKVIRPDGMCFPVDPDTYEALGCSCFISSPWAPFTDGEIERISLGEWYRRKDDKVFDN